jgi:rare lipoprotein A
LNRYIRVAGTMTLAGSLAAMAARAQTAPQAGKVPIDLSNPQVQGEARKLAQQPPEAPPRSNRVVDDHSGRKQLGKASVYAGHFQGRKMADGQHFKQSGHAAASKTLPLGTVAKVTNLTNGRTATVTVEDHGPFVKGRTVDLSKTSAAEIGLASRQGVAPVVVAPVVVPQADGTVKPGAGAVPGPASPLPPK